MSPAACMFLSLLAFLSQRKLFNPVSSYFHSQVFIFMRLSSLALPWIAICARKCDCHAMVNSLAIARIAISTRNLRLSSLRLYEILCITLFHLILHTRPPPLDSCLFPFASTNTVRSTRKPRYVKSFFFRSALLWNTLPANLQNITCHRKFKKSIEAHWSAHKYSTKFRLLPWSLSWWTLHDAKLHTPRTTCNSFLCVLLFAVHVFFFSSSSFFVESFV